MNNGFSDTGTATDITLDYYQEIETFQSKILIVFMI